MLPAEFGDLEPFAATWSLATEPERWARRTSCTIEELDAFYDAALPRIEAAIAYCDRFPLDAMPGDALNLLRLVYAFVVVSFAVELWRQPYVPDTLGTSFERTGEPSP
jgi:hypothetical protein